MIFHCYVSLPEGTQKNQDALNPPHLSGFHIPSRGGFVSFVWPFFGRKVRSRSYESAKFIEIEIE